MLTLPKFAVVTGMIMPSVLKSNLIAQQVVSEGQKKQALSSKKPMNGGGWVWKRPTSVTPRVVTCCGE